MAKTGIIRSSRRLKIFNKNLGVCVYCNEAPAEQIDHVLPRSWKINNDDDNLVGACADCNHIASDRVFSSFEEKQAYIVSELRKPKWKNRRVAPYRYMPTIIEKLQPRPKKDERVHTHDVSKRVPFTEQELSVIRKKLENALKQLSVHGKVQAYEALGSRLSELSGRDKDHVWGRTYIGGVKGGSVLPGRKFVQALDLYLEHSEPRKKQWFYFARRKSVATIYDKTIRKEIISDRMRQMGYKPVTYSRYMELKRRKAA